MTHSEKTFPVCPSCYSENILIDAAGKWNRSTQTWELAGTQDTITCQECDNEFIDAEFILVESD